MSEKTIVRTAGRTNVALKRTMAVTGFLFLFFLVFHCYGNIKMFLGEEAFDGYAHWLRDPLPHFIPAGWFLNAFRGVMLLALIVHVYAAVKLWAWNKKARGRDKYVVKKAIAASPASRYAHWTMRWGGVVIFLFLIAHILQFTTLHLQWGGDYLAEGVGPYNRMVLAFNVWWVWLVYLIAIAAVTLHVWHGVWSAMQSMGWVRASTLVGTRLVSSLAAAAIFIGFMAPPTAILLGFIK
ncbi:succinate dehydrogenase cytochrome b subunit [Buchananella hordeovulneris]|nr:succinate dehydrogenase cytochrome b subunit [Buchananella hordeovulneris]MDO5080204.1 succinate dehydrogenase cytochrome b subunit [Buchananella hordeovulneris]